MICVWIHKRTWRDPGPVVNVGVHNAYSFATLGHETHFVVGAGEPSDTDEDLRRFYGLAPRPELHIHRVPRRRLLGQIPACRSSGTPCGSSASSRGATRSSPSPASRAFSPTSRGSAAIRASAPASRRTIFSPT